MLSTYEQKLVEFCAQFTRLFPLWVLLAAFTAFYQPSLYTWFGNAHITWGLMFVMVRPGWGHHGRASAATERVRFVVAPGTRQLRQMLRVKQGVGLLEATERMRFVVVLGHGSCAGPSRTAHASKVPRSS